MKATISGVRGVVGGDYTIKHAISFCRGFTGMVPQGMCVVGRDTRPTGRMMADAAAAILASCGIRVLDVGVAPTPVVFREARRFGAGLVVTSSHNPIHWNGLKFVLNGRGINSAELDRITSGAGGGAPPEERSHSSPNSVETRCGAITPHDSSYLQDISRILGKAEGSPKVLVDAGGGAASHIAPLILREAGCRTGMAPDGPPRPDPTAGGLERLAAGSASYHAGFAFDMDGDRLVLAVGGRVQAPDATLGLGVAAAMRRGHRRFVISMDTSVLVERYITDGGGRVWRAPVGEANVVGAMAMHDAGAGGEGSSGGFILGEFNYCRDGMLAAGLIATMTQDTMRGVLDRMGASAIMREKVPGGADVLPHIIDKIKPDSSEVDTSDGVRAILDEDSWVLVRASNTEDVVRISAEAPTARRCQDIMSSCRGMVEDARRA